ncbi:MAG: prephenate dehydrogenase [Eubacterium sp.]|nr:prephenate dehydrogenase [Eubacterium sp.]
MKHLNLGFIGFGLIGGSIARALKKRGASIRVLVYTRRENPELDKGVSEGVIDELTYEIGDAFSSCDIVFLCTPVKTIVSFLPKLKNVLKPDCIITDVGSVKGDIMKAAKESGLEDRFIGGHPMAGSEKTGYENSTDILLENAFYILTPTEKTSKKNIDTLQAVVIATGAECIILPPDRHDEITAAISHVPHLVAVALVNLVKTNDDEDQLMKYLAAGGFRDITRIASSSPKMWEDICLTNSESIIAFLDKFGNILRSYKEAIEKKSGDYIYEAFDEAGEYRDSIPSKKAGALPVQYDIYVTIDDKAGAIASLASILSAESINIRNIGIVNNREFIDGVLRLELNSKNDADRARELLKKHNYEIVDRN